GIDELIALQMRRLQGAPPGPLPPTRPSLSPAQLPMDSGREPTQVSRLLDAVLEADETHVPALRTLEALTRRTGDHAALARVLAREGNAYEDIRARLGSLWSLAALEEWKLPAADVGATYQRILKLDPTD